MFKDNQFAYDLRIAWLSIKKTPILSALMVTAIGIGIGAFMTLFTLFITVNRDPIPDKSELLFTYGFDNRLHKDAEWESEHPRPGASYPDVMNLMRSDIPVAQSAHYHTWSIYRNESNNVKPFWDVIRFNSASFFSMFDAPFLYGAPWTKEQEDNQALVVVLPKAMNDRLYGGENSVGRKLQIDDRFHEVVGVLDDFHPMPKYFEFDTGLTQDLNGAFIPFSLTPQLKKDGSGFYSCTGPSLDSSFDSLIANPNCVWIHHWVQLASADDRDRYFDMLNNYALEQRQHGRFQADFNNRLYNVSEWIDRFDMNGGLMSILIGTALVFLFVCLVNTNALLFAKFTGKKTDICIKRALGCSKVRLLKQHLVEVSLIGLFGGLLGLLLTAFGLTGLIYLFEELAKRGQLDTEIILLVILTATFSTLIAGLFPAWRSVQLPPAKHLKSQ